MWRGKEVWVYAIVLINAWSISVYLLADGDDHCRKPARVFCVQASTGDFYDLPWLICCGSYHFCIYYQDKGHAKSRCNRGMSYKAIILRSGICSVKNLKTMILVWICYIDDFYVCWNFTINRHNLMYLDFFLSGLEHFSGWTSRDWVLCGQLYRRGCWPFVANTASWSASYQSPAQHTQNSGTRWRSFTSDTCVCTNYNSDSIISWSACVSFFVMCTVVMTRFLACQEN